MPTDIINGSYLCRYRVITDARGHLLSVESGVDLPFAIKRVYLIYGVGAGIERGFHAHRALEQRMLCVSGSCTVVVDNGRERHEVRLDRPEIGLHVGSLIWRQMRNFSPDCVLTVFASGHHDEADYIRDYDQFLAEAVAERSA